MEKYINERIEELIDAMPDDDSRVINSTSLKKRFLENGDWTMFERAVRSLCKAMYENGHLNVKLVDVVIGYEKVEDFDDDFTVFTIFDVKKEDNNGV